MLLTDRLKLTSTSLEHLRTANDYCRLCTTTDRIRHDQALAVGSLVLLDESLPPEHRQQLNYRNAVSNCQICWDSSIQKTGHISEVITKFARDNSLKI
jgi:hypothetical protein